MGKAPEAIAKTVASMPPERMFELMKQMKETVNNNPQMARHLLMENPQLAYALLQAQVIMRVVDPKVAYQMLHRETPAPVVPFHQLPESGGGPGQPGGMPGGLPGGVPPGVGMPPPTSMMPPPQGQMGFFGAPPQQGPLGMGMHHPNFQPGRFIGVKTNRQFTNEFTSRLPSPWPDGGTSAVDVPAPTGTAPTHRWTAAARCW